ncbi:50S ribosomal protein L32 [Candidatus Magnetominusculus dajiuhuensis]|uniref:50S ribosomal protein L32 n=1 Tax=Candidatus Magnetominusculus dajiuhuensis TaxID=3137712 RepID=UPI003B42D8BD
MANPTSRHSKSRRDKRKANWKGALPPVMKCPDCGEFKAPHRVCLGCGKYDGKEVLAVVEKE